MTIDGRTVRARARPRMSEGTIGRTSSAWSGGSDDTADLPTANLVVQLRLGARQCSGMPNTQLVVLTAAHCIDGKARRARAHYRDRALAHGAHRLDATEEDVGRGEERCARARST